MIEEKIDKLYEIYLNLLNKTEYIGLCGLTAYLHTNNFKDQPASTYHHYACKGGLLVHSLNVYVQLKKLVKLYNIDISEDSLIIIGLLHDLCKTDAYIYSTTQEKYLYNPKSCLPIGHSEKSIALAQRFFRLNEDEILSIRWHMGAFSLDKSNRGMQKDFDKAFENPIVLLTHMADWICASMIEKDFEKNVDDLIETFINSK